jgi:uncharacterized membrane protein
MASTDIRSEEHERGGAPETMADTDTPEAPEAPKEAGGIVARARALAGRLLDRYPPLPAAPEGPLARICLAAVALMALAFVVFFSAYLFAKHDAYQTFGEDLGIMDQALWNTVHGAVLHQTICNSVSDANCLGDVSRLGIHFEPIMFPISLLYLIAPSPKTLQLLQAIVVATGAFPAYWIASRRLRSSLAGVAFAAVYLLFPALQAAVTYDFHAVTLSAAFLMFALYFMLTRNNVGLFIACLLALSTKEQMPVDVAMIGLSIALLQRRWRVGLSLIGVAVVWLGIALLVMHVASPLGHSPTAGRYAYLGDSPTKAVLYVLTHPLQVLREHVLDPGGIYYLRSLLSPVGYLPLLSPLTLLIAGPAIAINVLSSYGAMRSGIYQYNADIVPVLVLAAIESVALLVAASGWLAARVGPVAGRAFDGRRVVLPDWAVRPRGVTVSRVVLAALTLLVLFFGVHEQQGHGYLPFSTGFVWPQATAHTRLADELLAKIPDNASVSAQADLVPHVSHRRAIYQFPYRAADSDYVFLDVTGDLYPYTEQPLAYFQQVQALLDTRAFHVAAAEDGYLLLARGPAADGSIADASTLPQGFYSFTRLAPGAAPAHPLDIHFGAALQLVGYDLSPKVSPDVNTYTSVTTYWRVTAPVAEQTMPELVLTRQDGSQLVLRDFATIQWYPMNRWRPGETLVVRSWPIYISGRELGELRFGMRVLSQARDGSFQPITATIAGPTGQSSLIGGDTIAVFRDVRVGG